MGPESEDAHARTTNIIIQGSNTMKHSLFAALIVAALAISACSKDSSLNAPGAGSSDISANAPALLTTASQEAELADMFYLDEDFSAIMSSDLSSKVNGFIDGVAPSLLDDRGVHPRRYFDMAALMYLRAALKADSTITQEQIDLIKAAINASNATRAVIAADSTLDATAKAAALKAEHDKLMEIIKGANNSGGILTAEQVAKTEELLAKIEAERQARHAQMLELRIAGQIARWNAVVNFTAEQKVSIADLLRAQDAQIQAARLQYKDDPEGFRAAVLAINQATLDAIRALLTTEQQALWDAMLAAGGTGGKDGGHRGKGGRHGGRHGG